MLGIEHVQFRTWNLSKKCVPMFLVVPFWRFRPWIFLTSPTWTWSIGMGIWSLAKLGRFIQLFSGLVLEFCKKMQEVLNGWLQHEGWSSVRYSTWDWWMYDRRILRFVAMCVAQQACTHSWSNWLLEPKKLDTKYSSVGYFAKRGHIVLPFRNLQTRMGCPDRRASVTKRDVVFGMVWMLVFDLLQIPWHVLKTGLNDGAARRFSSSPVREPRQT